MSDPKPAPKLFTPPEREDLWVPPSTPLPDVHEMRTEKRIFDPSARGEAAPSATSAKPFSVFVRALHDVASEYNEALAKCKRSTNQQDYDDGCTDVRAASKKFVGVLANTEKYGHDPEETFIDPVLNNGYILDLHIIADFTGTQVTHSSSMVSLISGSGG